MINWIFKVEGVTCTVDDMKTTDCFVQRRRTRGRVNKSSGLCVLIKDLMTDVSRDLVYAESYLIINRMLPTTDFTDPTSFTTG